MKNLKSDLPLVVITGPTASGKTSLAVDIAEVVGGEIICADSRSVYKHMDIGTAKPSDSDKKRVKHWALDIVEPDERFSVADFKSYALKKIEEIRSRNKIPFLVGGTGLYIDSIIFDYKFSAESSSSRRQELDNMSVQELYRYCLSNNIELPENYKNKRYLMRAIELKGINKQRRDEPLDNTIIVGITTERNELRAKIRLRAEQLFRNGVVGESKILIQKYGQDLESMKGNVYPLAHQYIVGNLNKEDFLNKLSVVDWRLAKRQLTWFKRNRYIQWQSIDQARKYLLDRLAK